VVVLPAVVESGSGNDLQQNVYRAYSLLPWQNHQRIDVQRSDEIAQVCRQLGEAHQGIG
jgi:hypothetical protein